MNFTSTTKYIWEEDLVKETLEISWCLSPKNSYNLYTWSLKIIGWVFDITFNTLYSLCCIGQPNCIIATPSALWFLSSVCKYWSNIKYYSPIETWHFNTNKQNRNIFYILLCRLVPSLEYNCSRLHTCCSEEDNITCRKIQRSDCFMYELTSLSAKMFLNTSVIFTTFTFLIPDTKRTSTFLINDQNIKGTDSKYYSILPNGMSTPELANAYGLRISFLCLPQLVDLCWLYFFWWSIILFPVQLPQFKAINMANVTKNTALLFWEDDKSPWFPEEIESYKVRLTHKGSTNHVCNLIHIYR